MKTLVKKINGTEIQRTEFKNEAIAKQKGDEWLFNFVNCNDGKVRTYEIL